ncbi:MAG: 4-phosphopantetheinyl transferase family protein, partial [Planctomycetes bacterium]|nr:4-phosphopantetheinyl transferase family protein [Planctomycetota bacterium]
MDTSGSLGNDLVSLKDRSNLRAFHNKRYLNKVFTEQEIALANGKSNPLSTFARLWSCKESAYKVMRKQGLRIGFNPSSFEVTPTSKDWLVAYRGQIVYTTSTVTDAYVHTIASSNPHILRSTHTKIEYTNSRKPSTISEIGKKK